MDNKISEVKKLTIYYVESDTHIEKIIYYNDGFNLIKLLVLNNFKQSDGIEILNLVQTENNIPVQIIELSLIEYIEVKFGSLLLPKDWNNCVKHVCFDRSLQ